MRNGDGRPPLTDPTTENIDAIRQSVLKSPKHYVRKGVVKLVLFNRSVRRILHKGLYFHLYKTSVGLSKSCQKTQGRI